MKEILEFAGKMSALEWKVEELANLDPVNNGGIIRTDSTFS